MSSDHQDKQGSARSISIIIGAIVIAVLLVIAACGGVLFLAVRTLSSLASQGMSFANEMALAQRVVVDFCTDLQNGKFDAARTRTSANFQKMESAEALRQLVESQPTLKKPGAIAFTNIQFKVIPNEGAKVAPAGIPDLAADQARIAVSGSLDTPGGAVGCAFEMVKEEGAWKIDWFDYAGKRVPPKSDGKEPSIP